MQLEGIHHVTAITGDARANVDFYTRVLGLRLVAKTVNQDDPTVYHLFYASETGKPGSELTFFEYPHARPGRAGAGMVHRIVSRVATAAALDFWEKRLGDEGTATERDGDTALRFADPEGLGHELAVSGADEPLRAEHPDVPVEFALGGFDGVRAYSADPPRSQPVLERVLGRPRCRPGHMGAARPTARRHDRLRACRRPSRANPAPAPSTTSRGGPPSPSTRAGWSACATPACSRHR